MATSISLYRGTTSLLNLNSGAFNLMRFDPGSPEHRDERVQSVYHHGEEVLYVRHKNAIATVQLFVLDSTVANVDNEIEALSEILDDIIAARGTAGEPYYLRVQQDGSSDLWQSEVVSARLLQSDDRASENNELASKYGSTDSYFRRVTLLLERVPWWEATSLTELSLSNGHGSGTGGIEIRNSNDSSNDNYAAITGSAILGDMRTPLVLHVERDVLGTDRQRKVHVSCNKRFDVANFISVYEIEDSTAFYGTNSQVLDTKYSNGEARQWTLASVAQRLQYKSFVDTQLRKMRGRWFRIILTVDSLAYNETCRIQLRVKLGVDEISRTDWFDMTGSGVHDIGAMKLPPSYLGDVPHMPLAWELWAYDPSSSSTTVILDAMHVWPSETEDGYMVGECWGNYLPNGSEIIFDGDKRLTYGSLAPTPTFMDYVTKTGKYIELVPGTDCRLYLLWDTYNTGGVDLLFASADETYVVQAWYRKRSQHI